MSYIVKSQDGTEIKVDDLTEAMTCRGAIREATPQEDQNFQNGDTVREGTYQKNRFFRGSYY